MSSAMDIQQAAMNLRLAEQQQLELLKLAQITHMNTVKDVYTKCVTDCERKDADGLDEAARYAKLAGDRLMITLGLMKEEEPAAQV